MYVYEWFGPGQQPSSVYDREEKVHSGYYLWIRALGRPWSDASFVTGVSY